MAESVDAQRDFPRFWALVKARYEDRTDLKLVEAIERILERLEALERKLAAGG